MEWRRQEISPSQRLCDGLSGRIHLRYPLGWKGVTKPRRSSGKTVAMLCLPINSKENMGL
eukprot:12016765-Karenia_brevis.AAC.1